MNKRLKLLIVGLLILMTFVGFASAWTSVATLPGNPDCTDINYIKFMKIDPDEGFDVPPWDGTFCDPNDATKCVTIDGYCDYGQGPDGCDDDEQNIFDWTSTFDIKAVMVKGSNSALVYYYDPGAQGDTGLTPPLRSTGQPPYYPHAISHIDFCIVTPEFPTIALPIGMLIGIVGLVYVVRKREN